jgi:hypothetical protein
VLAIRKWGATLANSRILFLTDNESIMYVINKQSSKDKLIMVLVRQLVVASMSHNIHFRAQHIRGKLNIVPDLLSRLQEDKARELRPDLEEHPSQIPQPWLPWSL